MEQKLRVYVPLSFFDGLLPFNAELLHGNSFAVRALAGHPEDASILRSAGYLLFGNGLATLIIARDRVRAGYYMEVTGQRNQHQVLFWELQSDSNQNPPDSGFHTVLELAASPVSNGANLAVLVQQAGVSGQAFVLANRRVQE